MLSSQTENRAKTAAIRASPQPSFTLLAAGDYFSNDELAITSTRRQCRKHGGFAPPASGQGRRMGTQLKLRSRRSNYCSSGNVWAFDARNNIIDEISSSGSYMSTLGASGSSAGQFQLGMFGIAIGGRWVVRQACQDAREAENSITAPSPQFGLRPECARGSWPEWLFPQARGLWRRLRLVLVEIEGARNAHGQGKIRH